MFITTRFYFPNGVEGEIMKTTVKEFDSFEKALKYCNRYAKGIKFAGCIIENEDGKLLYEINDNGDVNNYIE